MAFPFVNKVSGKLISHIFKAAFWEEERTNLKWMHLSQEEKAGPSKDCKSLGWVVLSAVSSPPDKFVRLLLVLLFFPKPLPMMALVGLSFSGKSRGFGKTACWHFLDLFVNLKQMSPSFSCSAEILYFLSSICREAVLHCTGSLLHWQELGVALLHLQLM